MIPENETIDEDFFRAFETTRDEFYKHAKHIFFGRDLRENNQECYTLMMSERNINIHGKQIAISHFKSLQREITSILTYLEKKE
jgi:hypothetical protein